MGSAARGGGVCGREERKKQEKDHHGELTGMGSGVVEWWSRFRRESREGKMELSMSDQ